MLTINATGSTAITVTLYENCINQINPYFTWELINKDSEEQIIFTMDDFSTSPQYYNRFTLSIATISGLTAGILNLTNGQYDYKVYEMNTPYDLDLNNAVKIVEYGILNHNATYSEIQTYTHSNTTSVYTNLNRS